MAYIGQSVIGVEHPSTSALNATTGTFSGAVSTTSLPGSTSLKTPLIEFTDGDDAIAIADGGLVTMPSQPAFLIKQVSNQSNISVNATTDITFDSEVYDIGSNFASNTFTAPVTGKYQLSYAIYLQQLDIDTQYYQFYLNTSNRSYFNVFSPNFAADAEYQNFNFSILADMDANDTAKVQLFIHNSGSSQADTYSDGTYFSGFLVC